MCYSCWGGGGVGVVHVCMVGMRSKVWHRVGETRRRGLADPPHGSESIAQHPRACMCVL